MTVLRRWQRNGVRTMTRKGNRAKAKYRRRELNSHELPIRSSCEESGQLSHELPKGKGDHGPAELLESPDDIIVEAVLSAR